MPTDLCKIRFDVFLHCVSHFYFIRYDLNSEYYFYRIEVYGV